MQPSIETTDAGRQYKVAQAAHYETKDLEEALQLYRDIMRTHPGTQEAGYSRSQILNIVSAVVPEQELFDAQVELATGHFAHDSSFVVGRPRPDTLLVADSSAGAT